MSSTEVEGRLQAERQGKERARLELERRLDEAKRKKSKCTSLCVSSSADSAQSAAFDVASPVDCMSRTFGNSHYFELLHTPRSRSKGVIILLCDALAVLSWEVHNFRRSTTSEFLHSQTFTSSCPFLGGS